MDNNSNNSYHKNLTKFLSNDKQTIKQNIIRKSPINQNNYLYIPNNGRNYFVNIKERLKKDRSIQAADKKLSITNQEMINPENYPDLNYIRPSQKEINLNDMSNINNEPKEICNNLNYYEEHAITNYATADTYLNRRHLQEVERINKLRKQKEKKELENKHIPVISKNSQKIVKNLLEKERYSNRNYSNSTYTSNVNSNNKGGYNINNGIYPPKCTYSGNNNINNNNKNNNRMINDQKMPKTPIGKESINKNTKCSSIKKTKCNKFIKDDYKKWLDKNYKKNSNSKGNINSSRCNNLKNQDSIYNTNSKCNILNDELLMDNKTPKYDRYNNNENDNDDDINMNMNNNKDGVKKYNTNLKKEVSYNFKDLFNHDSITNNTNSNKEKVNETPLKNYPGTNINTEHKDINNYNNYNNINYQSTNLIINNNPIISSINQNIGNNNDNNQYVNEYNKINLKEIRYGNNNKNKENNENNGNNDGNNNRYQSAANINDNNEKHCPYLNSGEQNFLIQKVSNYLNSKTNTNSSQNFQLDLDSREFALERLKDLKNRLNYNTNANTNNANNNNYNSNVKKTNYIPNNQFTNQNVNNNKNKFNYYK